MSFLSWSHSQEQELAQVYRDELSPREYIFGFQDQATQDASPAPDTEIGEHIMDFTIDLPGQSTPGPTRTPSSAAGQHTVGMRAPFMPAGPPRTPVSETGQHTVGMQAPFTLAGPPRTPGSETGQHTIGIRGSFAPGPPRTPGPTRTPGTEASQHNIDLQGPCTPGPEANKSRSKRAGSGKPLKDAERLALFNTCLELKDDYLEPTTGKKTWWIRVSQILEGSIGRPYSWESCRRLVTTLTSERQEYLKLLETGKSTEVKSDLTEAVDMWIEVVEQVELAKQLSKDISDQRRNDAVIDNEFRSILTERLGSNSRSRKRRYTSEVPDENSDDTSSPQLRRRSSKDEKLTDALTDLSRAVSTKITQGSDVNSRLSEDLKEVNSRLSEDLNEVKRRLDGYDSTLGTIQKTQGEIYLLKEDRNSSSDGG
jgi:hypothetical protein